LLTATLCVGLAWGDAPARAQGAPPGEDAGDVALPPDPGEARPSGADEALQEEAGPEDGLDDVAGPADRPLLEVLDEARAEAARALAEEIVRHARGHRLDRDALTRFIHPGPSESSYLRWKEALRPYGPVEQVLAASRGVLHIAGGPGYVRVVLDTLPVLSLVLEDPGEGLRVSGIEATTCVDCDERRRFVLDLLADVRRRGELGDRLQPDLELITRGGSGADVGGRWDYWSVAAEDRLRTDLDVVRRLASARVLSSEGEIVTLGWDSGATDTWRVVPTRRGWAVVYDDLGPDSPLRLPASDVRQWRKLSTRQEAAVATWQPLWRPTGLGAGRVVGQRAIGGTWDPHDETLLLTLFDREIPWAAVMRVDPSTGDVMERVALPLPDQQEQRYVGQVVRPPLMVTDATLTHLSIGVLGRIWSLDRAAGAVTELGRVKNLTALTLGRDGSTRWVGADGALAPAIPDAPNLGEVVAFHVEAGDPTRFEAVLADGRLASWPPEAPPPPPAPATRPPEEAAPPPAVFTPACPSHAVAAARRPEDGSWLVACGPEDAVAFVIVWEPGRAPEAWGTEGAPASSTAAAAWSPSGRYVAVPAPADLEASVVVWDLLSERPDVVVGVERPRSVAFSPDGSELLVVDERGQAVLWSLDAARRRASVRLTADAHAAPEP
jgi:hypothetical protein